MILFLLMWILKLVGGGGGGNGFFFINLVRVEVLSGNVVKTSTCRQGCISCGMCSYPELTEDHVLTSAYVKIFRTIMRNAVNKSV